MPPAPGTLRGPHGPGAPDYDPRVVDLYDQDNPDGPDHDFYRALADRVAARDILDLGCGTGLLTVTLAAPGRRVVGADPSVAMLDHARRRPGAAAVTWVAGDSRALGHGRHERFDLMILTGNAAQHIPDPDWQRTLHDLRRCCRDGAVLAFETRNPAARAWIGWGRAEPRRRSTAHGVLTEWFEVDELDAGRVLLRSCARIEGSGERLDHDQLLTFRGERTVRGQLADAGFEITAVWGDWRCAPFTGEQPIMVFEARAAG